MNPALPVSRQPQRAAWSHERLVHERAIALGNAIDRSTLQTYGSALNSYISFIHMHNLPLDPNEDTLSLYTVYMAHHINPRSVGTYLSGIVQQLEPYFPNVRESRNSNLVSRTLRGCMKMRSPPTQQKRALTREDLEKVINHFHTSQQHDDLLFVAMLLTGFFSLLRLREMSFPDNVATRDWRKVTRRESVQVTNTAYEFILPAHKADQLFESNRIMILANQPFLNPHHHFTQYLNSRDRLLPLASPLWIRKDGSVPTRAWFMNQLRSFFDKSIGGQSMRAGGATMLAELGTPPSLILASGRWSSETFLRYVRKHPALLQGMLYARARNPR